MQDNKNYVKALQNNINTFRMFLKNNIEVDWTNWINQEKYEKRAFLCGVRVM